MPSISKCPRCHQEVTIPDGVDQQASVRCPLCSATYPIGDAMGGSPPALIPVDTPAEQGLKTDSESLLTSNLVAAPFHTPDSDSMDKSPAAASTAETQAESAAGGLREPAGIDAWEKVDDTPQIDSGTGAESSAEVDTAAFAGFAEDDSDESGNSGASAAARPRRKKKQKSLFKEMAGAIIGGFVGLAVGYYGLNYFGGERFDFMSIYLPGVPHTYRHKPSPDADEAQDPNEATRNDEDPTEEKSSANGASNSGPVPDTDRVVQPEPSAVASPDGLPAEPTFVESEDEPQPASLPDDYVGLRRPPSFSSDDLGKVLKTAHDLIVAVEDVDALPAEAFEELCRLGHVMTFVVDDPTDGRLRSRKEAVEDILQRLADGPGRIDEIGMQAGRLMELEEVTEPGILLAGSARRVLSQGGMHGMTMQVTLQSEPISVLSSTPLPFEAGDQVVILGSIVTNPAENLVGYGGSKPKVIWSGMAVKARR
ncbi:MAG: hypothetical protein V3R99_02155 [Thermoguttaceae bacterium]